MALSSGTPASFALLLAAIITGCSGAQSFDSASVPVRTLAEIEAEPESVAASLRGQGDPLIIHVSAGDQIPLNMEVVTPLFEVDPGENQIRFTRDTYIYFSPEGVMLSPDRQRWARVGDWRSIKELFEIEEGTIQIGLGVSQEDGANAQLVVRTQSSSDSDN